MVLTLARKDPKRDLHWPLAKIMVQTTRVRIDKTPVISLYLKMYIQVKIGVRAMGTRVSGLNLNGTGTCASFNFRRAARAVTSLYDRAFEPFGIRSTQFSILVGVAKTQPTSISALSDLLVIDRTTLTRSLRLLKKQGLLSISARAEKRQRFLELTPRGARTLAASLPAWRAAQERFVHKIGAAYWANFRNELENLAHVAVALERKQSDHGPAAMSGARRRRQAPM